MFVVAQIMMDSVIGSAQTKNGSSNIITVHDKSIKRTTTSVISLLEIKERKG